MTHESTWNLDPPPGFRGLDDTKSFCVYQRHLPHWRQPGATYFVTFRLADSLPKSKLHELEALKRDWMSRHGQPHSQDALDELWRETFRRLDRWLDQGFGSCRLREPRASQIVAQALRHFDQDRYDLACYVVMPNHVHAVVRPHDDDDKALGRIMRGWKGYTARRLNMLEGVSGTLWQDEAYDRIIRDEEHLWRTIQYIGRNPRNANLRPAEYAAWASPAWQQHGWGFLENA